MSVPVRHVQVQDPGAEKRLGINAILGTLEPTIPELARVDDLRSVMKRRRAGLDPRVLLDRPGGARKGLSQRPEQRIIGHHHELRFRVQQTGGLSQWVEKERGPRMCRRGMVADDPSRPGLPPLRWE
jgi:hypothetical protein